MIITRKTSVRSMHNRGGNLNNKSKDEPTVYLYGDIGGWFGIDHLEFCKEFNKIDAETIHLRIDSAGGDIFAARAMKTCIMQHKANVIGHIDGVAASAASFLAMGCDEIEIVDGGFLMVHKAMSMIDILGYFNEDDLADLCSDMQKEMSLHSKINDAIANDYAKKANNKKEECLAWMEAETWFTAQEAMDAGLVDRIYDGSPVEGSYDLSIYAKVPDSLRLRNQAPSKRAVEKALRDVGLSNKQAKAVAAGGFKAILTEELKDDQRDVDPPDPPPAPVNQRDVDHPKKKDRIADLLTRAEIAAPSK